MMMQERDQPAWVSIVVDGETISARAGDSLAAALAETGRLMLRHSPRAGTPRGAFCHMGVCQECVLIVDGTLRQACLTPIVPGLRVETRSGA
jgi:aerobic-type carbon monoxide dehydrogenase small subunit (CoxS/CutS family)